MAWRISPLAFASFHGLAGLLRSGVTPLTQHQPQPSEPHRNGLAPMPAVADFATNFNGRLFISYGDGLANRSNKSGSRVLPILSQNQDGDYAWSEPNRITGSRSFVGRLIEKALVIFVRSQLDDCGDLRVVVDGSNLELLGGNLSRVEVNATKAIYKGIVISEVGLAAYDVQAQIGKKKFFEHPFRVDANVRIREQDFNSSLRSPLLSNTFLDFLPRKSQPLQVQYDNGNLRFLSSEKLHSNKYGPVEYPIVLRVCVEKGGEAVSVESSKSLRKTFKIGPAIKITGFQVGSSWMSLTGEFLIIP